MILLEMNVNANDVHFMRRIGMLETWSNFKEINIMFSIWFQKVFEFLRNKLCMHIFNYYCKILLDTHGTKKSYLQKTNISWQFILPGTCSGGTNTDSHAKHTKMEDGIYVCTKWKDTFLRKITRIITPGYAWE